MGLLWGRYGVTPGSPPQVSGRGPGTHGRVRVAVTSMATGSAEGGRADR